MTSVRDRQIDIVARIVEQRFPFHPPMPPARRPYAIERRPRAMAPPGQEAIVKAPGLRRGAEEPEEFRSIAIGALRRSDQPLLSYAEALNEIQRIIVRGRNETAGAVIVEIIGVLARTVEVSGAITVAIMDMRSRLRRN